jgi:hypothetical protein
VRGSKRGIKMHKENFYYSTNIITAIKGKKEETGYACNTHVKIRNTGSILVWK